MNTTNSITFSRESLAEYKGKYLNAKAEGQQSFVVRGGLVDVERAGVLIGKFEDAFRNSLLNEITLPCNF